VLYAISHTILAQWSIKHSLAATPRYLGAYGVYTIHIFVTGEPGKYYLQVIVKTKTLFTHMPQLLINELLVHYSFSAMFSLSHRAIGEELH